MTSAVRLFVPGPLAPHTDYALDALQTQYVSRSLRLRTGDTLTLFDGRGAEYPAVLANIGRKAARVETLDAVDRNVESPVAVRLLQGVSKGDRMDLVVQKSTELGVQRISPVFTEHSVVRLTGERIAKRREHWQRIAQSACEQCGRNVVPVVDEPTALIDLMGEQLGAAGAKIILQPGAPATLGTLAPGKLTVLVGPEGGFSEAEYERAAIAGFEAVGFGPRILRTETAAIAVLAAIQFCHGDAGS